MSDPIEQLNHFGDTFEGGPMQHHSAQAARQRGDRIRRRRTALVAAGSAAAVVAVAVPVFALANGTGGPDEAPPATGGPSDGAAVLTAANLLADDETRASYDDVAWQTSSTTPGDGQSVFHPCADSSLTGLGATGIENREWTLVPTGRPSQNLDKESWLTESVAQFPSAAEARAAYDEIAAAMPDCEPLAGTYPDYTFQADAEHPVETPAADEARLFAATYDDVQDPQGGGYLHLLLTGLVVSGDRIAVVTSSQGTQDFYPDPMEEMIPLAAERLVTGAPAAGGATAPATTEPGDGGSAGAATTIPEDFPLDAALGAPPSPTDATIDGPAPRATGPQAETACGEPLALPGSGPQVLAYSVSAIEGYDGRVVEAYPTAQDAVEAMATLRDQVASCDRDRVDGGLTDRVWQTYPADTGYEDSLTFGWTYEEKSGVGAPAGSLYTVVRVGNAILAVQWSGEGGAEYRQASVADQVGLVRLITPEMCVFTEAGC